MKYLEAWHPLNNRLKLANSWPYLDIKVLLLTVGWYSVACMKVKSICIYTYDGIKGGSAIAMQAM